jgi:hypothetical protein
MTAFDLAYSDSGCSLSDSDLFALIDPYVEAEDA